MGFFQDLKEDLSQAVNELMPDEELTLEENADEAQEAGNEDVEQQKAESEPAETEKILGGEELDALVSEALGETQKEETQEEEELKLLEEQLKALEEAENEKQRQLSQGTQKEEPEAVCEVPQEVVADMLKSNDTVGDVLEKVNTEQREMEKKKAKDGNKETKEHRTMSDQTMKLTGVASDENSIITAGMTITGNVASKGSLEVEGTIIGDVETLGKLDVKGTIKGNSRAAEVFAESAKITGEVHSDGTIKIGQSSVIIGNIYGKNAVIAGAVKGDIDVQGPVVLDTSAIVMGNIKSKSVQINNGAVIEGLCSQCYADVSPTTFFEEYKG